MEEARSIAEGRLAERELAGFKPQIHAGSQRLLDQAGRGGRADSAEVADRLLAWGDDVEEARSERKRQLRERESEEVLTFTPTITSG